MIKIEITNDGYCTIEADVSADQTLFRRASIETVANLFTRVDGSGFIPPGVFYRNARRGGELVAMYIPPQHYRCRVVGRATYENLPLPGMVFAGLGKQYYVVAIKDSTPTSKTAVFEAPLYNVQRDGHICPGNISYPFCTQHSIDTAWRETVSADWDTSFANGKSIKYRDDVGEMWKKANNRKAYPLADLVPFGGGGEVTLGNYLEKLG